MSDHHVGDVHHAEVDYCIEHDNEMDTICATESLSSALPRIRLVYYVLRQVDLRRLLSDIDITELIEHYKRKLSILETLNAQTKEDN